MTRRKIQTAFFHKRHRQSGPKVSKGNFSAHIWDWKTPTISVPMYYKIGFFFNLEQEGWKSPTNREKGGMPQRDFLNGDLWGVR